MARQREGQNRQETLRPEDVEAKYAQLRQTLENAVLAGLKPKIADLHRNGALPSSELRDVRGYVAGVFRAFNDRHRDKCPYTEGKRRYQEVVNLLVMSGVAQPITFGDWSVDRIQAAQDALGIRSFEMLERVLAESFADPADPATPKGKLSHIHKGSGTGVLLHKLRTGPSDRLFQGTQHERERTDAWQEVGVADKLYFSVTPLLEKFVRADRRNTPLARHQIHVLSIALQRALRAHWFTPVHAANNVIRNWEPKGTIDLNDIFRFLAHPETWLSETHIQPDMAFVASNEFDADSVHALTLASHTWLLTFSGQSKDEVDQTMAGSRISELRKLMKQIRTAIERRRPDELGRCTLLYGHITGVHGDYPDYAALLAQVTESFEAALGARKIRQDAKNKKQGADEHPAAERKGVPPQGKRQQLLAMQQEVAGLGYTEVSWPFISLRLRFLRLTEDERWSQVMHLPSAVSLRRAIENALQEETYASLADVFEPGFVDAVRNHEFYEESGYRKNGPHLDLNREGPQMRIDNIFPMLFSQMPRHFKGLEKTAALITGVRSESHTHGKELQDDMAWSMKMLRPGGVLLSDGPLKESYTRIMHVEEVLAAMAGDPELRAEAVMHPQTHDVLALLVQRRHPTAGFLTDDDKYCIWKDGVYFRPLEDLLALRPDLRILNDIRRQIIVIAEGDVNIFRKLHDQVRELLHALLIRTEMAKASAAYGVVDQGFMDEVRAKISAVAASRGQGQAAFGSRLDRSIPVETGLSANTSFTGIAQGVMRAYGADPADDSVVKHYERAIADGIGSRLHTVFGLPDDNDGNKTDRDRRKEVEPMLLDAARNVAYDQTPQLDDGDIHSITERLAAELRAVIRARPETRRRFAVHAGLETLRQDQVYAFPRLHLPNVPPNRFCHMPVGRLPDNAWFATREAGEMLEHKTSELRRGLLERQKVTGNHQLIVVTFDECVTNDLLLGKLRLLLGPDAPQLMKNISIAFESRKGSGGNLIRHYKDQVYPQLREHLDAGGIFVVGGSWCDAYDEHGHEFKQTVGASLMTELEDEDSPVRVLALCFGYQTMADLIGAQHENSGIATEPGVLEFLPAPVMVQTKHPLFHGCPPNMTLMQTHGGHVHSPNGTFSYMHSLATSSLTQLSTAYGAFGPYGKERLLGMQFHPEADVVGSDDQGRILHSLAGMEEFLEHDFGTTAADITAMCAAATEKVKANAGQHILANGLLHHLHSLPQFNPGTTQRRQSRARRIQR